MVNGQDVFFCDYFVDVNKKRLIKKKKEEIIGDYKRLQDKFKLVNDDGNNLDNHNHNHNYNVVDSENEKENDNENESDSDVK